MFKKAKKISAAVLSAVMMLTAVATPLGDNLPAVRDSVSMTASAASNPFGKWQTINGVTTIRCTYYAWQQAYDNTGVALPIPARYAVIAISIITPKSSRLNLYPA